MRIIILWFLSVAFVLAALGTFSTSVLGFMSFFLIGLYLSPFVRRKLPLVIRQRQSIMGWKGGVSVVSVLSFLAIFGLLTGIDKRATERVAKAYVDNPAPVQEKIVKAIETKEFFDAEFELKRLIASLPNDESLKQLWHDVFVAKLEAYASKGDFSSFSADLATYKELMGESPLLREGERVLAEQVSASVDQLLNQENPEEAVRIVENLSAHFPENMLAKELMEAILPVKAQVDERKAAEAARRAAIAKQAAECKADWARCADNAQLMDNYVGVSDAQTRCTLAANELAKFGDPDWDRPNFTTYYTGDDAVRKGTLRLVDKKVKFQNGFGAYQRTTVECHYDLSDKKVNYVNAM